MFPRNYSFAGDVEASRASIPIAWTRVHAITNQSTCAIYGLSDNDRRCICRHVEAPGTSDRHRDLITTSSDDRYLPRFQKSGSIAWRFLDGLILIERSRCSAISELNKGDTWRDQNRSIIIVAHPSSIVIVDFIRMQGRS